MVPMSFSWPMVQCTHKKYIFDAPIWPFTLYTSIVQMRSTPSQALSMRIYVPFQDVSHKQIIVSVHCMAYMYINGKPIWIKWSEIAIRCTHQQNYQGPLAEGKPDTSSFHYQYFRASWFLFPCQIPILITWFLQPCDRALHKRDSHDKKKTKFLCTECSHS